MARAYIDGSSRGNPGPATFGVLIIHRSQSFEITGQLGTATNNEAEYEALIAALNWAIKEGPTTLKVFSDSRLVVEQINGKYAVKSPNLKPLYSKAKLLMQTIPNVTVTWVAREKNAQADKLANKAQDE